MVLAAALPLLVTERAARGEGRKARALRAAIAKIMQAFEGPMSSRQVFYQCVSLAAVENNKKAAREVLRLLVKMRRDGSVPYERIVDRTRRKHQRDGWESANEVLDALALQYRHDMWADQKTVPMIACEKQALEGIFAHVVDEYGASLWTLRGFISESFAFEWAEEIRQITAAGRAVAITYFGDWDPSGLMIEADARRKLEAFGGIFTWERASLVRGDLERFHLAPIPVKRSDSRSKRFLIHFDDRGAELDALPPAELTARIRHAIEQHIDVERWERLRTEEAAQKASLQVVAKNWSAAVAAVRGCSVKAIDDRRGQPEIGGVG